MSTEIEVRTNEQTVKGLRELADFLEAHPSITPDYASICNFFWSNLDGFKAALENLGTFKKDYSGDELKITREFSGGVMYYATVSRSSLGCKKIVSWDCPDKSLLRQLGMDGEDEWTTASDHPFLEPESEGLTGMGLTIARPSAVERHEPTPMELMQQAMQLGPAGVDAIVSLTKLKLELEDRQAKREFTDAFRQLQKEIPPIEANGKTDKGVPYMYYEDIERVIRPLLDKHGFSKSFKESAIDAAGNVTFELHLSHIGGHREIYPRTFPTDKAATNSAGKPIRSAIQDSGSTTSYAKRYLTVSTFDIVEKGKDTDGNPNAKIEMDQATVLRDLCVEVGTTESAFLSTMVSGVSRLEDVPERDYQRLKTALETRKRARQEKKP